MGRTSGCPPGHSLNCGLTALGSNAYLAKRVWNHRVQNLSFQQSCGE
jgi:hypothetical protein